ncbi:MAG: sulfatase [Balneolales bacterium]
MTRILTLFFLVFLGNQQLARESSMLNSESSDHQSPNILIAVSDDQSYPHAGIYGLDTYQTPAFDRVAREGILFHNAFAAAPGCAPSRSSIHTGRFQWQNEEAGGHMTIFPKKYVTYPDVLEQNGYFIGYTGKGVIPFNMEHSGRDRNPAGTAYNKIYYEENEYEQLASDQFQNNYAANFENFLADRPDDRPFYFFYGSYEPHRAYDKGSGKRFGMNTENVLVPGFLPDTDEVRSDILDYALEINWFDHHLMKIIQQIEDAGELENTIIIVTSDQGMPFPRAKTNLYDYGLRVPLAVSWPSMIKPGREVQDLISLADIAPTLIDITGVESDSMQPMSAKSFTDILYSDESGIIDVTREAVYAGMERHSSARWANLGYPKRAIRTHDFLYIHNFAPERWPAGAPQTLSPENPNHKNIMHGLDDNGNFTGDAYFDIDDSPTKSLLIERMNDPEIRPFYKLAMDKRSADELYDVKKDPYNLHNLADDPRYSEKLNLMKENLFDFLRETGDPRVVGPVYDVFENYQRFGQLRPFPKPDWLREYGTKK